MKKPMGVMESACVSLPRSVLCCPLLMTITVELGAKSLKLGYLSSDRPLAIKGGRSEALVLCGVST